MKRDSPMVCFYDAKKPFRHCHICCPCLSSGKGPLQTPGLDNLIFPAKKCPEYMQKFVCRKLFFIYYFCMDLVHKPQGIKLHFFRYLYLVNIFIFNRTY